MSQIPLNKDINHDSHKPAFFLTSATGSRAEYLLKCGVNITSEFIRNMLTAAVCSVK